MGGGIVCFSSLIKRGRIRLGYFSDQFSFLCTQSQQFYKKREKKKILFGSMNFLHMVDVEMKLNCYSSTIMVDQYPDWQMLMKVTNQEVVMVMMVKLENQNLLNELVLEKIIFALAIENMTIETMTTNHHPKSFHSGIFFLQKKYFFLQQSSNSSAKYR